MSNELSIAALLEILRERDSFLITSHARPDGDAIGSSLGLMHLLEDLGKAVVVAFSEPIPDSYSCLPGVERIQIQLPSEPPDAAILLECDSIERSSYDRARFEAMAPALTINIDHHLTGREFAGFNWIDQTACAVGAMIYDLALASGTPITPAIAQCLYTAVLTDTGSFNYASTTAATFTMAAHLVRCGADPSRIAQAIYSSNPPARIRLLGAALSNLVLDCRGSGKVAWSSITLQEMDRAGATIEDCEGVVNHLISIVGVDAAVFLRETTAPNQFRLSLRSKGQVDVASVAERFGGGGHRSASGCILEGSLAEVTERILAELSNRIEQMHNVTKLHDSIAELRECLAQLHDGLTKLPSRIAQLHEGIANLHDGIARLHQGLAQLPESDDAPEASSAYDSQTKAKARLGPELC
jgi:phosphoesterase RecJ-like protein